MHSMTDYLSSKGFAVHASLYLHARVMASVGLDSSGRSKLASFVDQELPQVRKYDFVAFNAWAGSWRAATSRTSAGAARTGRFITISSPNRGTLLAYLLWNAAGKQMRPDSDFLNALNSDLSSYRGIQWATVRTPFDLTIVPSINTEMSIAANFKAHALFHPLMISDQQVNEIVLELSNPNQARKQVT